MMTINVLIMIITVADFATTITMMQERRIEIERALHPTPARLTLTDPKEFHLQTLDRGLAHRAQREQVRTHLQCSTVIIQYNVICQIDSMMHIVVWKRSVLLKIFLISYLPY